MKNIHFLFSFCLRIAIIQPCALIFSASFTSHGFCSYSEQEMSPISVHLVYEEDRCCIHPCPVSTSASLSGKFYLAVHFSLTLMV